MVEKNQIYLRHALKLRKIFTSRYFWNLFRIKNSPICSASDALSNGICLMIIYKQLTWTQKSKCVFYRRFLALKTELFSGEKLPKIETGATKADFYRKRTTKQGVSGDEIRKIIPTLFKVKWPE